MNVYVDEAMHQPGAGIYVVAAVLVETSMKGSARRAARGVPPIRGRRFHWHREAAREKFAMLDAVVEHTAGCRAYVASPVRQREQELARQRLIRRLVIDLASDGGDIELIIESRQHRNNQRDSSALIAVGHELAAALVWAHSRPIDEPLLWMADAVAGAALARARRDARYIDALPRGFLVLDEGP